MHTINNAISVSPPVCLYLTLSLSASLTLVVYSLGLFSLFDQFPLDGAWIIDCQTSLSYSVSNKHNCSSYTYTAPPAVQVMELIYHGVFIILCYLSIFHTERALYRKLAKYDEHPVIIWHHEITVTRMQFMTLFNNISSIFLGRQKNDFVETLLVHIWSSLPINKLWLCLWKGWAT